MNAPVPQIRYRAVSMELAAYLDERCVEMHILTDVGETVAIVCGTDSIFTIQRHIEQMGRECPEISTWETRNDGGFSESDRRAYQAAMWEGWPPPAFHPSLAISPGYGSAESSSA
jgi:hypothetical protein